MRIGAIESFINWIESKTLADHWSFDAAVGYAKHKGLFVRNEIVCIKTLYNYIHKGVLGIKAIDLPLVVRRSQRKSIFILLDLILLGNMDQTKGIRVYFVDVYRKECQQKPFQRKQFNEYFNGVIICHASF